MCVRGAAGDGRGGGRGEDLKTRTPHNDVGNNFKDYSSRTKELYFLGRLLTLEKTAALKIIVPEKRKYMSRSVPNAQRKASSKIIVPEKEELVF